MKNLQRLLSFIMVMFMTLSAYAHPGHGHHQEAPQGLMHYLTSPVHLISLLLVVGLAVYVAYRKGYLPVKPIKRG